MTLNLPDQEICEKYLSGIFLYQLTKEYNCDQSTIIRRLKNNKIKIRTKSEVNKGRYLGNEHPQYINLSIEEISTKYLNGMSTIELGKEYQCSAQTISNRLHEYGINVLEESYKHTSATKQGIPYNEWKGLVSKQKYCLLFNEKFKEKIRELYHRKCFLCNKSEENNNRKLSVHHVNYNKDCLCGNQCEFAPLCQVCHGKTGKDRKYWEDLIMNYLYPKRYFMVDI